jgi:uncharacterized Zn finger protein
MARRWGYGGGYGGYGFRPYVPVAQRRANAQKHAQKLAKNGRKLQPVQIGGRAIATTFWGKAWCDNLESYSDFENRLPRGRTYVRNGSVVDLQITGGKVEAVVSGSEIYQIAVEITPLKAADWKKIKQDCSQSIDSLMDLLQGRFSQGVMERLTRQREGLFPQPKEIKMGCSCPDSAVLCKHVAAVLYGVGARLDNDPEMLFQLRQVDHLELISQAVEGANLNAALALDGTGSLEQEDLGALFGIELESSSGTACSQAVAQSTATATSAKPARKRRSSATDSANVHATRKKHRVEKIAEALVTSTARNKSVKKKVVAGRKVGAGRKDATPASARSPKAKARPKKKK